MRARAYVRGVADGAWGPRMRHVGVPEQSQPAEHDRGDGHEEVDQDLARAAGRA